MTRKNWLRVGTYGTLGAIVLLFLAHPYTRQMVFGPRVAGMPLAYWQDRCRATALPAEQEPSFMAKVLRVMQPHRGAVAASDAEMLPVFLSLRDDPSEHVRAHVADLLGRYPDSREASSALLDFLDDPSGIVRAQALRVLTVVEPLAPLTLPKLRERLHDDEATCRLLAACAILRIEHPPQQDTAATLLAALGLVDEMPRFQAIRYICRLGRKNAAQLNVLRQAVANDPGLSYACASCLREAGAAGTPLLLELLKAREPTGRRAAAYQLGELRPPGPEVIAALVVLHDDADASVRQAAAVALWRIDPQQFAKPAVPRGKAPAQGR